MNFPSLNTESNTSSLSGLSNFLCIYKQSKLVTNSVYIHFKCVVFSSQELSHQHYSNSKFSFLSLKRPHTDMIRIVSGCLQGLNSSQLSGCVSVLSPHMSIPVWRLNSWSKSVHSVRLMMQSIHACVEERKKQIMYSVEEVMETQE